MAGKRKSGKRKGNGLVFGILACIFSIIFIAGMLSLGAMYYIEQSKVNPTMPEKLQAAANETQIQGITQADNTEPAPVPSSENETAVSNIQESEKETVQTSQIAQTTSESTEAVSEKESTEEDSTEEETKESKDQGEKLLGKEKAESLKQAVLDSYNNLGIITGVNNYLNIRKGPSVDYDIEGVIFKYCALDVLEEKDGWMKISSGDTVAYVASKYVTTGEEAKKLALEHMNFRAETIKDSINVLYEPKDDGDVITQVLKGERYDILGTKNGWLDIEAVEGLDGYVKEEDVSMNYFLDEAIIFTFDGVSELRQKIIRKAFEYYGGKYVWAGTELGVAVDCSGYTQQLYKLFGINLQRGSYDQANQGVTVDESTIRPGDLIFYVGRFPGRIGHVAIYIGNEKIIHAASESKGICVSNWKYVPPVTMKNVIGD